MFVMKFAVPTLPIPALLGAVTGDGQTGITKQTDNAYTNYILPDSVPLHHFSRNNPAVNVNEHDLNPERGSSVIPF
jgi:hypothetical protein